MIARFLVCLALCVTTQVHAKSWPVQTAHQLSEALRFSEAGDEILVRSGNYLGNFEIFKPLTLKGEKDSVIDCKSKGSCIKIKANNVTISGLTIKNYGSDLYELDSGVLIYDNSVNIKLSHLKIEGKGFGIRADHSKNIDITDCDIRGDRRMHVLDRGDGVYFKYVKNANLLNNKVLYTRDGFYFENTENSVSRGNYFGGLQYGIHYMYTQKNSASENKTIASIGGFALMDSSDLDFRKNKSERTVEFGILLNETNNSIVKDNLVSGVKNPRGKASLDTEGKGLFVYGGGENLVENNLFKNNEVGVGVAMGGEGTLLVNNAFITNKTQVRYVGTGNVEWSKEGKGNFWDTYQGWDLNADGTGDIAYVPNDSLDRIFWLYPEVRFLMKSPLVSLLKFISSQIRLDQGVGITDSHPLTSHPLAAK